MAAAAPPHAAALLATLALLSLGPPAVAEIWPSSLAATTMFPSTAADVLTAASPSPTVSPAYRPPSPPPPAPSGSSGSPTNLPSLRSVRRVEEMAVVLAWRNAKVVDPLLQVIQRGVEPNQLAFSVVLGVTIGIFPISGITVIVGGLAVAVLGARCNAVSVMVLNLAATPLELSLIQTAAAVMASTFKRAYLSIYNWSIFCGQVQVLYHALLWTGHLDVYVASREAALAHADRRLALPLISYMSFRPKRKLDVRSHEALLNKE